MRWLSASRASSQVLVSDRAAIHLRYDVGVGAGLGHLRRVQSLSRALVARGWNCILSDTSAEPVRRGAALVVDSYQVRADRVDFSGGPTVAIDDLDRQLDVDLLVEPSPPLNGTLPTTRRHLSGFEYALVEPFVQEPAPMFPNSGPVVLVSLGGADTKGNGALIAEAVATSTTRARVLHAPGPWSLCTSASRVETLPRDASLLGVLRAASVVVCAGGVTMLESMMCGRPTIALETASNQHRAIVGATRAGAIVTADVGSPGEVVDSVNELLEDLDRAQRLAVTAQRLVDGRGAVRVAAALEALLGGQRA